MAKLALATAPTVGVGQMLEGVQTGMMGQIGEALPIAGIIFGVLAGIYIAVKVFKKVTGART